MLNFINRPQCNYICIKYCKKKIMKLSCKVQTIIVTCLAVIQLMGLQILSVNLHLKLNCFWHRKKNLGFFELGFSLKRNMILHFDKAISLLQCLSVGAVTVVKCPKILWCVIPISSNFCNAESRINLNIS